MDEGLGDVTNCLLCQGHVIQHQLLDTDGLRPPGTKSKQEESIKKGMRRKGRNFFACLDR